MLTGAACDSPRLRRRERLPMAGRLVTWNRVLHAAENHHRDPPAARAFLVDVVARVEVVHLVPQPGTLHALGLVSDVAPAEPARREDVHRGVGPHVVVPGRVARTAGLRCDNHELVAVDGVQERGLTRHAALGSRHREQQHRLPHRDAEAATGQLEKKRVHPVPDLHEEPPARARSAEALEPPLPPFELSRARASHGTDPLYGLSLPAGDRALGTAHTLDVWLPSSHSRRRSRIRRTWLSLEEEEVWRTTFG